MRFQISSILLLSLSLAAILIGSSSKSFVTALTLPGVGGGQGQGLHSPLFRAKGGYDDGMIYCPEDSARGGSSSSLMRALNKSRFGIYTGINIGVGGRPRKNMFSLFANDRSDTRSSDGDDTSSSNQNDVGGNGMKKITTTRAGGRSQSQVKRRVSQEQQEPIQVQLSVQREEEPNAITKFAKNALPVLLFFLIIKSLLGGLFGSGSGSAGGSYVFYQSTVYESTTYDSNGQSERVRKESFKTNIPGYTPSVGERDSSNYRKEMRKLNDEIERDLGNVYRDTYRSTIVEDFYD